MIYHDGKGHRLNLAEDPENPPAHRTVLFVMYKADCERCWHSRHAKPVATCLTCNPPQPLEVAA